MGAYTGADKRLKYLFENGGGGGGGTDVEANPQGTPTAYLNTIKIENSIYSVEKPADIYSLEERQVGVFTDGKPLYQKTIYLSSVTSGQYYAHNITDIDKIWVYDVKANRNTVWFSSEHIFSSNGTVSESFSVIANGTYIYPIVYSNTITDCYVTVQYTKTTDAAGSGIWTPQGSYAHHYSTDEQIIGTWIDGSTLYERTFKPTTAMSIPVNGTWYNTNININYVNKIVEATVGNDTWVMGVFSVFKNSNLLYITSGGAMGSNTLSVNRITIRYTKS